MKTPNIINWLSSKAGELSTPDAYGLRMAFVNCAWKDIRGLHTQLRGLSDKGTGKYTRKTNGGNSPDASYRFTDADGIRHCIETFATGRITYSKIEGSLDD